LTLAVRPLDALAQREGQRRAVLAPAPACRQVGRDLSQAVLLDMLIEYDEIVEDPFVTRAGSASISWCIDRLG